MTHTNGVAATVAQAYFEAMANRDIEKLMTLVADDVVCSSPVGQLEGATAFHGFQEGFARMINNLTLIAAFGDDQEAVVVYDADTAPVKSAIVAEHLVVKNGKIASTQVIYDATPFAAYMATLPRH